MEKYPAERRLVTSRRKAASMMTPIGSWLLLEKLPCFFVVALKRMSFQTWGMKMVVDLPRWQESLLFFGKNRLESKRDLKRVEICRTQQEKHACHHISV
jgi:hypothetical protein